MAFTNPLALLGLLLIPVLILLERWRSRPREQVWPSLLLWRAVSETEAPARRRIEPLLLYECAAVALLALAAAGPEFRRSGARRVLVLRDEGPHMQARRSDDETARAATDREIDRIRAEADEVTVLPVLDLEAALASHPHALLATGRDLGGGRAFGYAGRGYNYGIDAVRVTGDRLWFAVATDGPPATVRVRIGTVERRVATGRGVEVPFAREVEILDPDNYDRDDVVRLRRIEIVARNDTGSALIDTALFRAGLRARRDGTPGLVVTSAGGRAVRGTIRGSDCTVVDPLFDGLLLDDCAWNDARLRDGAGALVHGGGALATWGDGTLWLGMPVDREWDGNGTLAILIERALRARVAASLLEDEAMVGDAVAMPAPGHVDTGGVDRPWNGTLPAAPTAVPGSWAVRSVLAILAAFVLALYVRALHA